MNLFKLGSIILILAWSVCFPPPVQAQEAAGSGSARELFVTVGKSLVVESPVVIQRVSVANGALAEAIAVTPREVLVNGRAPGETSLLIWQQGGARLLFDLKVRPSTAKLEAIRNEMAKELGGQDVSITLEDETVFLRGTVRDRFAADRAVQIANTLGKTVNLLNVRTPEREEQILLRVRFANVDRSATQELGVNLFSTGALNTTGILSTQQFRPPAVDTLQGQNTEFTLSDALNIFLFRPDLNLGATIRALQAKQLLQILAEPNVLTSNGRPASFLAGGEVPVPVVQSGVGGAGTVTIQWREFGVRVNFVPTITARGTIRLHVAPEVSSLDFANATILSGFTVPGISTRRVETEIELEPGQSFAIAGLLDNRAREVFNKIPGIGDIPVLGKLFQSRATVKSDTELLVVVTPEFVRPIPAGQPIPGIGMPLPFLEGVPKTPPRTPGMDVTGPVPVTPQQETIPYERLIQEQQAGQPQQAPQIPWIMPVQMMPVPAQTGQQPQQSPVVQLPGANNR